LRIRLDAPNREEIKQLVREVLDEAGVKAPASEPPRTLPA
jgi:hypothetical protein